MKYLKIKIGGKKYRINIDILIQLLSGLLIVCVAVGLISFIAGRIRKNDSSPQPVPVVSGDPDSGYDASAGVLNEKEYKGTMLAKTKDAGKDYIDSTLFIGDSNTARFIKTYSPEGGTFTGISNTIGVVGMGIDAISSLPCMQFSTGMYAMPQAVSILQPERIIITFGTNNLYGSDTDATSFIARYEQQLKNIVAAYPSVDLIVNSIPPVSRVRQYPHVTMTQIDAYNRAIADMCTKNDWKYLNSAEALKDEKTGFARDGYMDSDGLHFSQKGLTALFEYIRTHSWIKKDDRPKPLNAIPTIYGVPDGLIQTNPLNNKSFEEEPVDEVPAEQPTPVPTPEQLSPQEECEQDEDSVWYQDSCILKIRYDCEVTNGGKWEDASSSCNTETKTADPDEAAKKAAEEAAKKAAEEEAAKKAAEEAEKKAAEEAAKKAAEEEAARKAAEEEAARKAAEEAAQKAAEEEAARKAAEEAEAAQKAAEEEAARKAAEEEAARIAAEEEAARQAAEAAQQAQQEAPPEDPPVQTPEGNG